jgi:hypothetical protein
MSNPRIPNTYKANVKANTTQLAEIANLVNEPTEPTEEIANIIHEHANQNNDDADNQNEEFIYNPVPFTPHVVQIIPVNLQNDDDLDENANKEDEFKYFDFDDDSKDNHDLTDM